MRFARKFAAMLAVVAFILSTTATTTFAEDVSYIEVVGMGVGPINRNPKSSFYKLYLRQAAQLDALRQLAECTFGIETNINTSTNTLSASVTVTKLIADNAQIIKERILPGGGYEITMRMPMDPFVKIIKK